MRLYDLKAGMNTRRVRIFLAEKGLQIPLVEIDMKAGENRSAAFLSKNPMGTMPVLELDNGSYLAESVAICRYLEEAIQPEPNLFGRDAGERAEIEMWNRRMELEIVLPLTASFQHSSPFWKGLRTQIPEAGELARKNALQRMGWLDKELSKRSFVVGSRYTIADITAQCGLVLGKHTGTPIPKEMKNLDRWFREVSARPTARA